MGGWGLYRVSVVGTPKLRGKLLCRGLVGVSGYCIRVIWLMSERAYSGLWVNELNRRVPAGSCPCPCIIAGLYPPCCGYPPCCWNPPWPYGLSEAIRMLATKHNRCVIIQSNFQGPTFKRGGQGDRLPCAPPWVTYNIVCNI